MDERRIDWTRIARRARIKTLCYWTRRNGNSEYSKKLKAEINENTKLLTQNVVRVRAKPTKIDGVYEWVMGNYSLFYEETEEVVTILMFWGNHQDREGLWEILS